jgi:hypothetical protein
MRFASAIVSDEVDRGRAQEAVVQDLATGGFLDQAWEQAREIAGWRRGTALADLGARFARAGRFAQARQALLEARTVQARTGGWQGRRIALRATGAQAALGEVDAAAAEASRQANEDNQYAGMAEAMSAPALAARGDLAQALLVLGSLDEAKDLDASMNRTQGYLDVAAVEGLDREQRLEVLARTGGSAAGIPGWAALEKQARVAMLQADAGDPGAARATLEAADASLWSLPATLPVRAMLLSRAAAAWGRAGEPARGVRLLGAAADGVPAMPLIDQPAAFASVAAGHALLGNTTEAARWFSRSLDEAARLVNARPRALAVVEIAREMARAGWAPDETTTSRLDALLGGLGAPW